jgi:hypothetical protein
MLISQLAKITEDNKVDWNLTEIEEIGSFTLVKCNSKTIYRYGFNKENHNLMVLFRQKVKGKYTISDIYSYKNVEYEKFLRMNESNSKGKFLDSEIKKKKYSYEKRIDLPPF